MHEKRDHQLGTLDDSSPLLFDDAHLLNQYFNNSKFDNGGPIHDEVVPTWRFKILIASSSIFTLFFFIT